MNGFKLSGLNQEETDFVVPENTILLGYMGSKSHNTYVPSTDPNSIDDIDIMGVCADPMGYYLGLGLDPQLKSKRGPRNWEQQEVVYKEWDSVVYEVQKFFKLLLRQNPNCVGLLWLPQNSYIHISPEGDKLIKNRDIFVSKKMYEAFIGYAKDQRYKMTHQEFQGYMGAKRKGLVEKFGYDTKNAAHMIRLLRMLVEYLTEGVLHVFRHDASELKEIKRGEWTLDKAMAEADRLFILAQEAYVRSPLPPEPDYKKADVLLQNILFNTLGIDYINPFHKE